MRLDDLKEEWQQEIEPAKCEDHLKALVDEVKTKTLKIDKEIKRRDILEILIALLLIPFWVYGLFSSAGNIQSIGLWVLIIACLFIPYKLIKAKQVSPTKDASVKGFLIKEQEKLKLQNDLVNSVVWWYLLPLLTGIILVTLGGTVNEFGVPQITEQLAIYYSFLGLLCIAVYLLNKRAANKKFAPLLKQVEKKLAQLDD